MVAFVRAVGSLERPKVPPKARSSLSEAELRESLGQPAPVLGYHQTARALLDLLAPHERVLDSLWGKFESGKFGLLAATTYRVIAVERGAFTGGVRSRVLPYEAILVVKDTTGMVFGGISLATRLETVTLGTASKKSAGRVAQCIRETIAGTDLGQAPLSAEGDRRGLTGRSSRTTDLAAIETMRVSGRVEQSTSLADELAKLVALRDQGGLTESEFTEAKRVLLSKDSKS